MNRKGFTLIEVLAVIIIIGIILVIAVPSISNVYNNSKLKSEQVFINRLSTIIDSYIELKGNTIAFSAGGYITKGEEQDIFVESSHITMQDIIKEGLLSLEDYGNAGNKDKECNPNAEIEVYRDANFVYCHKVHKDSLGCLSQKYKDSVKENYVIVTCVWDEIY